MTEFFIYIHMYYVSYIVCMWRALLKNGSFFEIFWDYTLLENVRPNGTTFVTKYLQKLKPTVSPNWSKHVPSSSSFAKGNVINFFVVGNQLCLDMTTDHVDSTQNLSCFQSPNGASCVNTGRSKQVWIHFVPVKRSQWRAKIRIFVIVQKTFLTGFGFTRTPNPQIVTRGG